MATSELSTMVAAEMASVRVARRFVQTVLPDAVPVDVASDLTLATSELVTNAVENGSGTAIQVTVRVAEDAASVTVTSTGESVPVAAVEQWQIPDADALSGRGLGIVRPVADEIEVARSGDSLAITLIRRFAAD